MIATQVYCCRCTYDLRGLVADGRCPECGLDIFYTLQHLVDPMASKLPRLRDPVGVGNAMLWFAVCCLAAALLLVVQTLGVWLDFFDPHRVGLLGIALAHDLTLLAAAIVLLAMWSVYKFTPSRKHETSIAVRIDVWLLGLGLAALSLLLMALWQRERHWAFAAVDPDHVAMVRSVLHIASASAAAMAWVGVQRVLRTIGKRSRAYRSAHGGRQNIRPMIAATIAIAGGSILRLLDLYIEGLPALELLGKVIVSVSLLMLLIGLGYLVINAWWIRQALRHPPPRLEDLLVPIQ